MAVRLTARARLAVLLTGLILAAGVVLTGLTYVLLRNRLGDRWTTYVIDGTPRSTAPPGAPLPPGADLRADVLRQLLVQSAIALAVVTVLAAALGWLLAGRILRPVRDITATARRLSAENLGDRVPVGEPNDELAELSITVNDMLDRIQVGVAGRDRLLVSQRLFVANAAHELRTPLATMRAAIDVTLDGDPDTASLRTMAVDVGAAVDRSRRTLDGLLTLARSQAGPRDLRRVDLAELARPLCAGLDVRADLRPAPVDGEPVLLTVLLGNLIDNAVRYNRPDGWVSVQTGVSAGSTVLRVVNSGAVVPPERAAGLLEPFVHGTAGGAGLGLSIVRAVVDAHGGTLTLVARPEGGLDVTVRCDRTRSARSRTG